MDNWVKAKSRITKKGFSLSTILLIKCLIVEGDESEIIIYEYILNKQVNLIVLISN